MKPNTIESAVSEQEFAALEQCPRQTDMMCVAQEESQATPSRKVLKSSTKADH
jgi:hypothetical protein